MENFYKILNLKVNHNKGISEELLNTFPNITPIPRPVFPFIGIPDAQWLVGFIDGEGCFIIDIQKRIDRPNPTVVLYFYITQHIRDYVLMNGLVNYFNCGYVIKKSKIDGVDFKVGQFEDISLKIIPFLEKYPLQSVKKLNFEDWVKASKIIMNKEHKTLEGLNTIQTLKGNMNRNRKYE